MKFSIKSILTLVLIITSMSLLNAQPPGRGPRPGGGPEEMMKREKQAVLDKIQDLTEDQKLLLDGIYSEFSVTLMETFQEARQSGNREGLREKMSALREEKDGLIGDVLNEEQYKIYESIGAKQRERMRQRRANNNQESTPGN